MPSYDYSGGAATQWCGPMRANDRADSGPPVEPASSPNPSGLRGRRFTAFPGRPHLIAAALGVFTLLAFPTIAAADDDTTPPEIHSMSVSPTSVDVTNGPATVTVTATITDDLSGVCSGSDSGCPFETQMGMASPSGNQTVANVFYSSGGDQYTETLTIPQYAEGGSWAPYYVELDDKAGNSRNMTNDELKAQGINVTLEVTGGAPPATVPEAPTPALILAPALAAGTWCLRWRRQRAKRLASVTGGLSTN